MTTALARALVLTLGLAAVAAWGPARAQDRPTIEITPGKMESFRVAVQRFADEAQPSNPARARDLREALHDGLRYSGVLIPIADDAFLGDLETSSLQDGPRYDCGDWKQSGADALVEGRIFSDGGRLGIEYAVWDTARCRRLERETLRAPRPQAPRLARRVADAIVGAFTGTRGAAATEIAFISTRTGEREVFVMNADGSRPRPATRSRTIKAFPDWLPGAEGILYTAYHDGSQPSLYVTARSPRVRAGEILSGLLPGAPKYRGVLDPEGDTLALVASVDGAAEIFLVDREERDVKRLTTNGAIDISPAWSPDGERLAFVSDRSGSPQIYIVGRDGEGLRRLTFQGSYNTAPVWSPDGRWIAYETRLESQFDIWLVDPSGRSTVPLVQHRLSDETPSWSPDGRKIAFSSNRRGRYDIYVVDVGSDGSDARRLTGGEGENKQPVWGPFPQDGALP